MAKGGSGTSTVTSGIASEFLPMIRDVLGNVTDKYKADIEAGPDNVIAGLTDEQKSGLNLQKGFASDMATGSGAWDLSNNLRRDMQNVAGTGAGAASMGGALGSARTQAATQKAIGDISAAYQDKTQQNILGGGKLLGDVGSTLRQYQQQRLDAPDLMASRYFGYLTGAPQQKVQTKTGGK